MLSGSDLEGEAFCFCFEDCSFQLPRVIISAGADYCLADYCLDNGYQSWLGQSTKNILQYIVAFIATMMCVYCGTPKSVELIEEQTGVAMGEKLYLERHSSWVTDLDIHVYSSWVTDLYKDTFYVSVHWWCAVGRAHGVLVFETHYDCVDRACG
ncbi:hypothetical protein L2E82_35417 [Cichorium intybus]|uniref:Uncharacterized protein n=1 Tax=Cichorium intybus TaxID=13427 RepID=A0ACB9BNP3_CICIN|nr:hypothetical protein L2E82_35417 [Cichorium intybus]